MSRVSKRTVCSIALLSCFLGAVFLTGCTTSLLWHSQQSVRADKAVNAVADQIYVTFDKEGVDDSGGPKYCVVVRLSENTLDGQLFPGGIKKYLVIKETAPVYRESSRKENYEALFNSSIIPIDLYAIKVDKSSRWELNVSYMTTPRILADRDTPRGHLLSFSNRLDKIPPFNYYHTQHYPQYLIVQNSDILHDFRYDPAYAPNIFNYYSLCCRKSEGAFYDSVDTTGWLPLLPKEKQPLKMKIYLFESDTIYDHFLITRLIATPVTVVVDVITYPFQYWFFSGFKY